MHIRRELRPILVYFSSLIIVEGPLTVLTNDSYFHYARISPGGVVNVSVPRNPGDKPSSVFCGSWPEASFDEYVIVEVCPKREFHALSATSCPEFLIRYKSCFIRYKR